MPRLSLFSIRVGGCILSGELGLGCHHNAVLGNKTPRNSPNEETEHSVVLSTLTLL